MTDDIVTGITWVCILTVMSVSAVSPTHSGKEFKVKLDGLLGTKQKCIIIYILRYTMFKSDLLPGRNNLKS
jgi:hypothetical protein